MKKFTCLLIIMTILYLFIPSPHVAFATSANAYARVINDTTPIFSDNAGKNLLFYLPYTYYVKILGEENEYYHVEYGGYSNNPTIDGYVLKTALYFDDQEVLSPYPNVTVVSLESCTLYTSAKMDTPVKHIFANRTIKPYGINYAPNGSVIYFITYNDTLGYVYESHVAPFTIKNHDNPLTFLDKEVTPQPETPQTDTTIKNENKNTDFLSLRIVIIVCLVFAGVIALFVAIKNASKKHADSASYYEENDYE